MGQDVLTSRRPAGTDAEALFREARRRYDCHAWRPYQRFPRDARPSSKGLTGLRTSSCSTLSRRIKQTAVIPLLTCRYVAGCRAAPGFARQSQAHRGWLLAAGHSQQLARARGG
jgi:hypothetical protein